MKFIKPKDAENLINGTLGDPFSILGLHEWQGKATYRVYYPEVDAIDVININSGEKIASLEEEDGVPGLFVTQLDKAAPEYQLRVKKGNETWLTDDPYRFEPVLGELDEHLIGEGAHKQLWRKLGAKVIEHEGVAGTHFSVWAPNALRVSVVGDFNNWNGRQYPMRKCGGTGVWEIFLPGISEGSAYKFELIDPSGNLLPQKADPFGFGSEHPPKTASIVRRLEGHCWSDGEWMKKRQALQCVDQPISIYEVHLGSWKRKMDDGGRSLSYVEHANELVPYVKKLGFTHIELMPISEFPFDGSWGYQPIGLFAPTIRYGTPEEFRGFVEACHDADIGLLLDWVPGHFPEDEHGLGLFDGTHLYEHSDRKEGFHPDWNTLIYNFGRREIANYLSSNALYWLKEHHVDGLRVDAVASMLYRDYSRKEGEWIANKHGGRENLEAIDFLRHVNEICYGEVPGIMTAAEESTSFPDVTKPTSAGGLGFGYKWNMGWMNDTLSYMQEEPINRKYHHQKMTFGIHYGFSENFILPLSHDEVVHGKGSLVNKMPGNHQEQFANLRAYYGFMWGHPGKKLLFMGAELAQANEWNHDASLDWHLLEHELNRGVQSLIRDLNFLYRSTPSLYQLDCRAEGFRWIEENDSDQSIFAWLRLGLQDRSPMLVVSNMTPVERTNYRVGVPLKGRWIEKLNTDAREYGGSGRGNLGSVDSQNIAASGHANSVDLTLPPLSTLFFQLEGNRTAS
ncbi:MAG: 1,4-alpha-glucan branching protein GlgB [Hyphomicrobiales bacterium]|nr:1,4-alpha-glucan branching protein GlgB [Hyphomicrobiales bacterium]